MYNNRPCSRDCCPILSLQDVGPLLRNRYFRCMEAMLLKDCESEEDININVRLVNADTESILQAIIQEYVSFHTS